MPPPTVLAAKLTPPRLAHAVLRRGQLEAVQRGAGVRVLYVQAPAGYGKTTLLAEAARRLRWDHVWYRFDVLDADTLGLVAGLTESLRSLSPSFGESLRPLIAGDETPSLAELAARFIRELDRLHVRDLHLILDDYHEVAGRDDVNALLDLLLLDLPPGVHVVFASRSKPAFSTGKLSAAGELRTLGPADLRFTRRQAEAVLGALGSEPSAERLDALLETTGGWAAGVVLAGRVADLAGVTQAATEGLPGAAASSVFDYLTEEVLRRLPDDAVRLVEGTCCLPYVTPRIAARLTGVEQAKRVLDGLVSGGVFTTADEREETYQYHDLFAAYLRVRVQARGGGEALRDLMRRTAGALAAEGHLLRAVAAFLDAEDLDGALDLMRATWGQALAVCGRPLLERLAETLSVAGAGYADWLPLVRTGIANRLEASPLLPDEAAAAAARLAARSDRPAAFIGYILACRRALRLADFAAACAQADAAAQVADGDEPRAEALRWQALSSIYALRWDDAQEAVERLELCAGAASPAQLVQARAMRVSSLIYAGELAKAAADASIVAPRMLEAGSARSAAGFYSLVGQLYACLAEYETAARAIDTGLELCELEDAAAQRPNLLDSRGFLLASQGRFGEAIALLEECAVSPLAATDLSFEVMVATHLGTSLRRGGDLLAAIEWYRRAAEATLDDLSYEKMNARINFVYASGQAGGSRAGGSQAGGPLASAAATELRGLATRSESLDLHFQAAKASLLAALLEWRQEQPTGTEGPAGTQGPDGTEGPAGTERLARTVGPAVTEPLTRTNRTARSSPRADGQARLAEALRVLFELGHRNFVIWELSLRRDVVPEYLAAEDDSSLRGALLEALARHVDAGRLLALALSAGEEVALQTLAATAGLDPAQLLRVAVRARRHPSPQVRRRAAELGAGFAGEAGAELFPELTPREVEILGMLAGGDSNDEIAAALVLSPGTVKTHVHRILTKLCVRDRRHAGLVFRERIGN